MSTLPTSRTRHLILIGPRGAGKTTAGRAVAERVGAGFTDLDDVVLSALGVASVTEAWARFGEPAFRSAEANALTAVMPSPPRVIALGGGTPTIPAAAAALDRARIDRKAIIAYLTAPAAVLHARISGDMLQDRPPLTGLAGMDEIEHLLTQRAPVYERLASVRIDTNSAGIDAIVDRLVDLWRQPTGSN
ncbi:MAG: hypothetical protein KF745_06720 [Phycisphaeraceae bacterium]|nr:hypothetical protein [Phycisphaeraceae bacterium]